MTRPDPAQDLIAYLRWLGDRVEEIAPATRTERFCLSEAARRMGFNPRYFHGHPERVPGFGLKGKWHTMQEWRDWLARPEWERLAEWDAIPARERVKR